jgi:hypothetical protein
MLRFAITVLLFSVSTEGAKKPVSWETGHVVSQDISTQPTSRYVHITNTVVVDVGSIRYTWSELYLNVKPFAAPMKPVVLTVNTDLRFYRDKDSFVVLDAKGKEHRFALTGSLQLPETQKLF